MKNVGKEHKIKVVLDRPRASYANSKESGKPGKHGGLTLQNGNTMERFKSALQQKQDWFLFQFLVKSQGINQNSHFWCIPKSCFSQSSTDECGEALRWNLRFVYQQWTSQGKKEKQENLSYQYASCHATFPFQLAGWHPGKEPMFSCLWWC